MNRSNGKLLCNPWTKENWKIEFINCNVYINQSIFVSMSSLRVVGIILFIFEFYSDTKSYGESVLN